jgi:energy-dependent translational throttle protein EttA
MNCISIIFLIALCLPSALSYIVKPGLKSAVQMRPQFHTPLTLYGKKDKDKAKFKPKDNAPPSKRERQSQETKFDALTRRFMFTIQGLTKALPDGSKTILKNINLCFFPGAKIGVVGANGSGKSSLLKIMAGIDNEFEGTATPMPGASIGYLPQEPILVGETVIDNINLGVVKGQAVLDRFTELSMECANPDLTPDELQKVMEDLEEIQNKIEANNLWELDRFKQRAMEALGCPPADAKIAYLSGGEKRRVALARLLLENHDLLLLDEPTNHLDAASVGWLEKYLQDFKGTVVAITHDRYFLENSCSWILELDRGQGIPYEGNYSQWLFSKQKRFEDEKKQDERLKRNLQSELEWIQTTPSGRQTKSKARLNRYEELLDASMASSISSSQIAQSASIYIPPGPRLGNEVIEAHSISKKYGDRVLIQELTFSIPPNAIVGIVGPNGAGKVSSFASLLFLLLSVIL